MQGRSVGSDPFGVRSDTSDVGGATRLMMFKAEIKLEVRLTPRAGRDQIGGRREGVLQVRVKAPPVDGKANEALRKLIAKRAGVDRYEQALLDFVAS